MTHAVTVHFPLRSLLNSRCVVRPSSLDDLWSWGSGLVIQVAVIRGRAVTAIIVADMDNHAGSGGCCSVKLILFPWSQLRDGTQQVIVDDWCGVLRLFPADRRRGRRWDQELLIWLGRLQTRTSYVDRLSKVESYLFAVEVCLMQSESCLSCSQSIPETDPDPPEGLKVLELHLWVKWTEQSLKASLHLRVVKNFLVGHWCYQAEAVTLGRLDVHDRRPGDPQPLPPDNWVQGAMQRCNRQWSWWWRGRGESGGSEDRCFPQGDWRAGNTRQAFFPGTGFTWESLFVEKSSSFSPSVFTADQSTMHYIVTDALCYTEVTSELHTPPTHIPRLSNKNLHLEIKYYICWSAFSAAAAASACPCLAQLFSAQKQTANSRNFPEIWVWRAENVTQTLSSPSLSLARSCSTPQPLKWAPASLWRITHNPLPLVFLVSFICSFTAGQSSVGGGGKSIFSLFLFLYWQIQPNAD